MATSGQSGGNGRVTRTADHGCMLWSIIAGLALVPCVWLFGSLASVALATLAGEARFHLAVRRIRRRAALVR